MKITPRYILREHVGPLLFALSALTSLLLLNFIAKRFGELVGKGLPWSVIIEFVVLSVPFTLAMTFPMAVLVATLHAFSRFTAENEITAFKASGVSMQSLVRPVILASFVLAAGMVWFNDQVLPRANHRLATLQSDIARVKPTLALSEQVINEIVRGQLYLRAARVEAGTNRMRDVAIYDLSEPTARRTVVADSGLLAFSATGEDLLLTLFDGNSTEISDAEPSRLQRSFFETDLIRVRNVNTRLERDDSRVSYKSDREMTICELHTRVEQTLEQRDSVWSRLGRVDAHVREQSPPFEAVGLSALYCGAAAWWRDVDLVQEAGAAQATPGRERRPARPDDGAVPQRREDPTPLRPGNYDDIVLTGLQYELQSVQSNIDRYRVEIEKKFAIAAACVVFVLLGAPIALRFPRGGVGLTIGASLGVFALYYVGLLAGEALADKALVDPSLAMWGTNILLGVVGIVLTLRLGSEGSTSRGSETSEWWSRTWDRVRGRLGRRRPA